MRHHRTVLPLAGYTIQQIDFDPATFQPEDLFWLPYHASLTGWGRKRQAEHLAGRIAAAYALREVGEKRLPAIGDQRQPLWPTPWFGSISHCGTRAGGDRRSAGGCRYRAPVYPTAGRGAGEQHYRSGGKNSAAAQRPALPAGADAGVRRKRVGLRRRLRQISAALGFRRVFRSWK